MFLQSSPRTKRHLRIVNNLYFSPWDESSVETVPRSNQSRHLYNRNGVEPTVFNVFLAILVIMLTISSSHHITSALLKYHAKFQLKFILQDSNRAFDSRLPFPNWTKATLDIWATRNDTRQHEISLFWYIFHPDGPSSTIFFPKCLELTPGHFIWSDNLGLNTMSMKINAHVDKAMADSRHFPSSAGTDTSDKSSEFQLFVEQSFLEKKVPGLVLTERIDLVSEILDSFSVPNKEEPSYRFRAFVILRHPIDTALREYLDKKILQQDSTSFMSLKDYFTSKEYKDNMIVRMLNGIWNDFNVPVSKHHLDDAKENLHQKFLLGIFERLSESMTRFERYHGWWRDNNGTDSIVSDDYCQSLIDVKGNGDLEHFASSADTSLVHNLVMKRNWADMDLYSYAQVIFDEQKTLLNNHITK